MKVPLNQKYCIMHQNLFKKYDYDSNVFVETDNEIVKDDVPKNKLTSFTKLNNPTEKQKVSGTIYDQKVSTVMNNINQNEDMLQIKLLILVNGENGDEIENCIGPIFNDITLSEDSIDPITFDEIWSVKDNRKVPGNINKYFLFSYVDCKSRIRCLTIFTMYSLIKQNNLVHPITLDPFPEEDLERAKKLINIYQTSINLFDDPNEYHSREFLLESRLIKLYKQFHSHTYYYDEKWLLDITSKTDLLGIMNKTNNILKESLPIIYKNMKKRSACADDLHDLKECIVDTWENAINICDKTNIVAVICIIAVSMMGVVPMIIDKYPDLLLI